MTRNPQVEHRQYGQTCSQIKMQRVRSAACAAGFCLSPHPADRALRRPHLRAISRNSRTLSPGPIVANVVYRALVAAANHRSRARCGL
jgi:hypothetical protein